MGYWLDKDWQMEGHQLTCDWLPTDLSYKDNLQGYKYLLHKKMDGSTPGSC